jgi:hypothetical protein
MGEEPPVGVDEDGVVETPILPFAAWFQDLRGGRAHAEITDALWTLVEAVATHQKDGELVLRLKVKPADGGGAQVVVTDETIIKAPQARRPVSLFFVDPKHNLTREDPLRPRLPLREVPPQDNTELKEAKQ